MTKSDLPNRILYEFDGRPCGKVYAEVLEVPTEEIPNYFVSNPLGIVADGEIFMRTFEMLNKKLTADYCALWGRYPSIGFSTGREAFLGHINETSTVLIIK